MTYLPFKSDYYISRADGLNCNPGGWVPAVTTDRNGVWMYYVSVTGTAGPGNPDAYLIFTVRKQYSETRKSVTIRYPSQYGNQTIDWGYGSYEYMPSGINWDFNLGTYFVTSGSVTVYSYLFFIPTTGNRGM